MNRKIKLLIIGLLTAVCLSGCGKTADTQTGEKVSTETVSPEGSGTETLQGDETTYMTEETETIAEETEETLTLEEWIEKDKERAYYDVLEGKTIDLIGDSYFAGHILDPSQVWPSLLAEKYGMTCVNYGINGSSLSNYTTENSPMVDRYESMPDNDPDIVLVDGGRNDYNLNVPIGEDGSTDTKTMKGALRTLLTGLQEKYPGAKIICITVWEVGNKANGLDLVCSDYGRAMIEVCEDMGVACINAMDSEDIGVDMTDIRFRRQYCLTHSDISHLNLEGMKLVLPVFEAHIAEIYSEE